jgi:hypothetical protein
LCYSGVTVVLQCFTVFYSGGTVVLKWCYHKREVWFHHQFLEDFTVHIALSINNHVTVVVQWCYNDVTVVLQWCYSGVTVVL